jgi:nucleoside-diphosphate-sugar epimerase
MTILVIGSEGYIGSKLVEYLNTQHDIDKIDILQGQDVESIQDTSKYTTIIYLAAHSGVKKCIEEPHDALVNNVTKFINFTKLLNQDQKFIYMSSASVYGDTNGKCVNELEPLTYPYNVYDFTKQVVDEYMAKTEYNYYALRLGTVNGKSPKTRSDLMINAMIKSAQDDKYINVFDENVHRAMLDINDLCRLIHIIINSNLRVPGVYNVSSFNATVGEIGHYISKVLSVDVKTPDNVTKSSYNFRMDTSKVEKVFNFKFQGTLKTIVDSLVDVPKSNPLECKVCKNTTIEILNFSDQPLVYTLSNTCGGNVQKYPLILDYCEKCSFVQSRFQLDSTGPTFDEKYINWLCDYIDSTYSIKTLLDTSTRIIADKLCIDYGWACTDNPELTISLNVLSHVKDVHGYIEKLVKTMGKTIILQIPYADGLRNGYFDTIYHGHNNYFNLTSLSILLSQYGLYITRVEKTSVHDGSYLLTIEKQANTKFITPNEKVLVLSDYKELFKKYKLFKLNLMEYVNSYKNDGYTIVGYGANIKGNSIVNLMDIKLDYMIDDDACKRGLFMSNVQIYPITRILNEVDKKLVVIPFTRKYFEHIHQKLIDIVLPTTDLLFLKLFPEISIVYRDIHKIAKKIKTTVIMHFYNEEYLLPYWLNHHKYMFDHGILINYGSTDKSVDIIKKIVPNWTLIDTQNPSFDLKKCDEEVMAIERTIKGWKTALNVTEFLCCDNLSHLVEKYQDKNNAISIHCIPMVESVEYESNIPLDVYQSLVKQRTFGVNEPFRKSRTIHCAPDGQYDGIGRHYPKVYPHSYPSLYEAAVLWYGFSPFNDAVLQRKLQIQEKMTEKDKMNGIGREHVTTKEALQEQFANYQNILVNFKEYTETAHYFKKTYLCW